jgi:hypothetical protein
MNLLFNKNVYGLLKINHQILVSVIRAKMEVLVKIMAALFSVAVLNILTALVAKMNVITILVFYYKFELFYDLLF